MPTQLEPFYNTAIYHTTCTLNEVYSRAVDTEEHQMTIYKMSQDD